MENTKIKFIGKQEGEVPLGAAHRAVIKKEPGKKRLPTKKETRVTHKPTKQPLQDRDQKLEENKTS